MPKLNASDCCATQSVGDCGSINFGDERRLVLGEEAFNARKSRHKSVGEVRKRRLSHNHQQRYAVSDNRVAFVRLVSNSLVVS
jgi:hypothetical protein